MAIIARALKLSGSTDYVAGFDILAAEVNADLNTLYADYNGNITAANAAPAAGFLGTQLASKPNGVATININAKAVTDVELANDPANNALRAVGPNHIKSASIILQHVKVSVFSSAPGGSVVAGSSVSGPTGLTNLTAIPLHWVIVGAGVPTNTANRVNVKTMQNAGTNEYYIAISGDPDPAGVNLSLVGLTFHLYYIPIS